MTGVMPPFMSWLSVICWFAVGVPEQVNWL
jgi:hypothetical protein